MTGFSLRAFETTDAPAVFDLLMRPKVRHGTMVFMPYTSLVEGHAFLSAPINGVNIVATSTTDSAIIGHITLSRGTRAMSHSGRLGLAVHDEWWRRGIATSLLTALIDTATNWLGLTRITLEVFTDNAPAIALYEKHGFIIEGTLRHHMFRNSHYIDSHTMARLTDPPKLAPEAIR